MGKTKKKSPIAKLNTGKPCNSAVLLSDSVVLRGTFEVEVMNNKGFSNVRRNSSTDNVSSLLQEN